MLGRRGPGLIRGVARTAVVAGTASAVSGRVQHKQQQKWANQEAEAQQQTYAEQQQAQSSTQDVDAQMEQLTKLGQLRDQGILTPEEFEAKKQQILGL